LGGAIWQGELGVRFWISDLGERLGGAIWGERIQGSEFGGPSLVERYWPAIWGAKLGERIWPAIWGKRLWGASQVKWDGFSEFGCSELGCPSWVKRI